MICRSCGEDSAHVKTHQGIDSCHACGDFRESGGARTSGILTRSSLRVRQDAVLHEGDTIHPYEYDKTRKKIVPSKEFVKKFPNQAHEYFTNDQVRDAGFKNLPSHLAKRQSKVQAKIAKEEAKVQFIGDQTTRQKEVLA